MYPILSQPSPLNSTRFDPNRTDYVTFSFPRISCRSYIGNRRRDGSSVGEARREADPPGAESESSRGNESADRQGMPRLGDPRHGSRPQLSRFCQKLRFRLRVPRPASKSSHVRRKKKKSKFLLILIFSFLFPNFLLF